MSVTNGDVVRSFSQLYPPGEATLTNSRICVGAKVKTFTQHDKNNGILNCILHFQIDRYFQSN